MTDEIHKHMNVRKTGDMTKVRNLNDWMQDPAYFDFMSFCQYATIAEGMRNGQLIFEARAAPRRAPGHAMTRHVDIRSQQRKYLHPVSFSVQHWHGYTTASRSLAHLALHLGRPRARDRRARRQGVE